MGRGPVTNEQAGEQMPILVRHNTEREQVGGVAGSTRAFLDAVRASLKTCTEKSYGAKERTTEREVSGIGPTALRPLSARDAFFFLHLL